MAAEMAFLTASNYCARRRVQSAGPIYNKCVLGYYPGREPEACEVLPAQPADATHYAFNWLLQIQRSYFLIYRTYARHTPTLRAHLMRCYKFSAVIACDRLRPSESAQRLSLKGVLR